jgi:hypothetical protein
MAHARDVRTEGLGGESLLGWYTRPVAKPQAHYGWRSIAKLKVSQALVAHACNPCYSEGRDQKDHSLKPA